MNFTRWLDLKGPQTPEIFLVQDLVRRNVGQRLFGIIVLPVNKKVFDPTVESVQGREEERSPQISPKSEKESPKNIQAL